MTRLLDLFSGIGAFSLGLERAGFQTVAFCEIEPFCRRVLAKHWPDVPIYDDVRLLTSARLRADGIDDIDAICGGFPCQDISVAGAGAGLDGERSGLWREYARLVGELRPRFVVVENVGALRARGLAQVLGDFAALGYDASWESVPAAAVGAPHLRDRVWIVAERAVADPDTGCRDGAQEAVCAGRYSADSGAVADPDSPGRGGGRRSAVHGRGPARLEPARGGFPGPDTDANGQRCQRQRQSQHGDEQGAPGHEPDRLGARGWRQGSPAPVAGRIGCAQRGGLQRRLARSLAAVAAPWQWPAEPPFRRGHDAAAKRLDRDRLKALGNSVVPAIPEAIGRALLEAA